jgi:hypothetical protein
MLSQIPKSLSTSLHKQFGLPGTTLPGQQILIAQILLKHTTAAEAAGPLLSPANLTTPQAMALS